MNLFFLAELVAVAGVGAAREVVLRKMIATTKIRNLKKIAVARTGSVIGIAKETEVLYFIIVFF